MALRPTAEVHRQLMLIEETNTQLLHRVKTLETQMNQMYAIIANYSSPNGNKNIIEKLLVLDLFTIDDNNWVIRFRRRPATKEHIDWKSNTVAIWKNLTLPRQYMKKIAIRVNATANSHMKYVILTNVKSQEEASKVFMQVNDLLNSFDRLGKALFFPSMDMYLNNSPMHNFITPPASYAVEELSESQVEKRKYKRHTNAYPKKERSKKTTSPVQSEQPTSTQPPKKRKRDDNDDDDDKTKEKLANNTEQVALPTAAPTIQVPNNPDSRHIYSDCESDSSSSDDLSDQELTEDKK